jgi:hypothetical protein
MTGSRRRAEKPVAAPGRAHRRQCARRLVRKSAWFFLMVLIAPALALAQATAGGTQAGNTAAAAEGKEISDYHVEQSIELGYRFSDVNGSGAMFDTFINQHAGPRFLDQTLSMHSLNNAGVLFDDLNVSSFGWGGDPENAGRVSLSKNKWYDFSFLFRRDQNFFNYDLLANPLNPPISAPNLPVGFSPHEMQIRRRMYDTGLTLMPQSKITLRLGYTRNRSEGPSFSSFHEGTDPLLDQAWNVTQNDYHFGVDFKVLSKTSISYDQFLQYDRNDTNWSLSPYNVFLLPDGTPVSLGLPINSQPALGASDPRQPCSPVFRNNAVNPACNGYFAYTRSQRVRTSTPTESLSLQSNYFKRVNLVARSTYSSADMNSPYAEFFSGLVTRTGDQQFTFSGPAHVRRISASADLGVTVELTSKLNLSDNFRYDNWHVPGTWDSLETVTCLRTSTGDCRTRGVTLLSPIGSTESTTAFVANFLGQKSFLNLIQAEYQASKHFGVHLGFRLRHRHVFKAEPEIFADPESGLAEFEGDSIDVNEYGPVLGVWFRPRTSLRINLETELTSADNFLTRISPRQRQNYRARASYRPVRWANLAGSMNIWESRNGESDTQFKQHYRNAGFVATLLPKERVGFDVSYNYTNALQQALICFNDTFIPAGTIANGCPTFDAAENNNPNQILSTYVNHTHYFLGDLMVKPVQRVTAKIGYGLTSTNGTTTLLNPLQPLGPLDFTYHQPLAELSYEVAKYWSVNAYWNYDQYNEGSFIGPTSPRYFHDNRTTLSVKYAF